MHISQTSTPQAPVSLSNFSRKSQTGAVLAGHIQAGATNRASEKDLVKDMRMALYDVIMPWRESLSSFKNEKPSATGVRMGKREAKKSLSETTTRLVQAFSTDARLELAIRAARTAPEFVRFSAVLAADMTGEENAEFTDLLCDLSTLALNAMSENELAKRELDTPSQILLWYADHLERILDKSALEWNTKTHDALLKKP